MEAGTVSDVARCETARQILNLVFELIPNGMELIRLRVRRWFAFGAFDYERIQVNHLQVIAQSIHYGCCLDVNQSNACRTDNCLPLETPAGNGVMVVNTLRFDMVMASLWIR